jgi:hypothetical protein
MASSPRKIKVKMMMKVKSYRVKRFMALRVPLQPFSAITETPAKIGRIRHSFLHEPYR